MNDPLNGLALRWALPQDVKVIGATWLNSARAAWYREPGAILPIPDRFSKTINETRTRMSRAIQIRDNTAATRERHLLDAIFDGEFKLAIQRELFICPPVVLYDLHSPILVLGWASAHAVNEGNWVFVKERYRRLGYGIGLYRAIGSPTIARMLTRSGQALMDKVRGSSVVEQKLHTLPVAGSIPAPANG